MYNNSNSFTQTKGYMNNKIITLLWCSILSGQLSIAMNLPILTRPSALVTLAGGELARGNTMHRLASSMDEPQAHAVRFGSFLLLGGGAVVNCLSLVPLAFSPELSMVTLAVGNSLVYLANKAERTAWEARFYQQSQEGQLKLDREEFTKNHCGLRALWSTLNAANNGGTAGLLLLNAGRCCVSRNSVPAIIPLAAAGYCAYRSLYRLGEAFTFAKNWDAMLAANRRAQVRASS